jgi:hypothetical protein
MQLTERLFCREREEVADLNLAAAPWGGVHRRQVLSCYHAGQRGERERQRHKDWRAALSPAATPVGDRSKPVAERSASAVRAESALVRTCTMEGQSFLPRSARLGAQKHTMEAQCFLPHLPGDASAATSYPRPQPGTSALPVGSEPERPSRL